MRPAGETPPPELLRFRPRSTAPRWSAEDFAAWLRSRAVWQDAHTEPLPGLPGRERVALTLLSLPLALVEAEQEAPKKLPYVLPGSA